MKKKKFKKKDNLSSVYLKQHCHPFYHKIDTIKTIDSTNDKIKEKTHLEEGYVLISDTQTKGRGRNGKTFFSQEGKGIYLSVLLKPSIKLSETLLITAAAAVSIVEAIKEIYNINSQIKWVNDIFINDKKIAGILCESSLKNNTDKAKYIIMGIGINVHKINFPGALSEIASSIENFTSITKSRNELIISFLNTLYEYYKNLQARKYLPLYSSNLNVINKNITVYENNISYEAKAIKIDENAYLHIIKENGEKDILSSAEITIKKTKD